MTKDEISIFVRINSWANDQILGACEGLSAEAFTRPLTPDPGRGSLRGILVHALDTEYGWRCAMTGEADHILKEDDFPDIESLIVRWNDEKGAWQRFIIALEEGDLQQGYGDDLETGPKVWQTIMHVVMHGVQHRSEAAAFLTGLGRSPGELDLAIFLGKVDGQN